MTDRARQTEEIPIAIDEKTKFLGPGELRKSQSQSILLVNIGRL